MKTVGASSTFSFDPDTANTVYPGDERTFRLTDGINQDEANQEMEDVLRAEYPLITFQLTDLGTTSTMFFRLNTIENIISTFNVRPGSGNISLTSYLLAITGAPETVVGVPTIYSLVDPDGVTRLTITGSVTLPGSTDLAQILTRLANGLPPNYIFVTAAATATSLTISYIADGSVDGLWTLQVNNQGQVINAGTIPTTIATETQEGRISSYRFFGVRGVTDNTLPIST